MKQIIAPEKQKFILVFITALVSFLGLESANQALLSYQIKSFFLISLYIYLFLVFLQSFVFDLALKTKTPWSALASRFSYMLKLEHFLHYQNYLVLPGIIYWSAVSMMFLNPFDLITSQVVIVSTTVALTLAFWYLKTVFYAHKAAKSTTRQAIFLVKIF